jgi:hypothetical protein
LATTPFIPLVEVRAKAMDMSVPLLVLPFPFETKPVAEIQQFAHERAEELVGLILARIEYFKNK